MRRGAKLQVRTKLFDVPLYGPDVYVVHGNLTGAQLHAHVLKRFKLDIPNLKEEGSDQAAGSCNRAGNLVVVWLNKACDGDIIAHESFHAVLEIMRFSGLELTEASEEAYAYLIGWLVQAIGEWVGASR